MILIDFRLRMEVPYGTRRTVFRSCSYALWVPRDRVAAPRAGCPAERRMALAAAGQGFD